MVTDLKRGADMRLDNTPDARKLLDSLRYLGYDNLSAICDLIDNSLDADAEHIWVSIVRAQDSADFTIQVADDGVGMNENVLDRASRLGGQVPRNPATDLGRFGMGLVTASLSLGRRLTIMTKTVLGSTLVNITDIDHMVEENRFVKQYFGPARADEEEIFNEATNDSTSGTVVQITKTDGFKVRYSGASEKAFEKTLANHIGRVYRSFIRAGRSFYVNGAEVPVNDPLFLEDGAEVHTNEAFELKYTDAMGNELREPVHVRLVILPDFGSAQENRKKGYNVQHSGFYVLRNNREIAGGQLLGLDTLSRHPDFIRFRGELFITGHLDDVMGIEFTKRDVKPVQSIRNQLDDLVGPSIKSIRKQLKKKIILSETERLDHSSAEKLIDSKSGLLIKPSARNTTKEDPEVSSVSENNETRLGVVKFRVANFGKGGPIYAAEQHGKTIFIDWNGDHPFYERFLLSSLTSEDREALNAVDALVFSMAAAELKVFDEDNQEFIETWKAIFSANLRTLLS